MLESKWAATWQCSSTGSCAVSAKVSDCMRNHWTMKYKSHWKDILGESSIWSLMGTQRIMFKHQKGHIVWKQTQPIILLHCSRINDSPNMTTTVYPRHWGRRQTIFLCFNNNTPILGEYNHLKLSPGISHHQWLNWQFGSVGQHLTGVLQYH